jgi:hypothetical protein
MWVVASTAAILISSGVLYGLIYIAASISSNINEDRLAGIIMLPITATILGVGQWLILRSRIPKSGWWIPATIVGIVGSMALAVGVFQVISRITRQGWNLNYQHGMLMSFVLIGFFLALAQLPILWRYLRAPIIWLLANMIGWFILGLIVDISIDRTSDIIAVGAIPAIFTGFGLIWLMRKPCREPEQSS